MLQNALDAKRAHELAKRDDLTGLFNDRWFNVRLTEALVEARVTGREAVLIFLDLDRFKVVNDSHGHLAGSQVLREIGFLLKRIVQSPHATVARYGGDEFVMILANTSIEEGLAICEEIREAVEKTIFLSREWGFSMQPLNLRGILTASIGVAQHLPDRSSTASVEIDKNDLLKRADDAMYLAKSRGKNQVVVSRAGDEIASHQLASADSSDTESA
jgi:diguanylate cyclase (GGDEF)-like protein